VLYEPNAYGENAYVVFKSALLKIPTVCLALEYKMPVNYTLDAQKDLVEKLFNNKKARVVITISYHSRITEIIPLLKQRNLPPGHFIWLWTDVFFRANNVGEFMTEYGHYMEGTIVFTPTASPVQEFDDWFANRRLSDCPHDKWFRSVYEHFCHCSVDARTCNETIPYGQCDKENQPSSETGSLLDAITVLANATAKIMNSPTCMRKVSWRECLTPLEILHAIKSTRGQGYSGWVEFTNGDRLYKLEIWQISKVSSKKYALRPIGHFHISGTGELHIDDPFQWPNNAPVTSDCSEPCRDHSVAVRYSKMTCCWDCMPCLSNQVKNGTMCVTCPPMQYPSSTEPNKCEWLMVKRLDFSGFIDIAIGVSSACSIILCVSVMIFLYRKRHLRFIKATSLELSAIMLVGLLIGYLSVLFSYIAYSDALCIALHYLRNLSFCLLYVPLMLRSLRIYRIMGIRITTTKPPMFTMPRQQILLTCGILVVRSVVVFLEVLLQPSFTWYESSLEQSDVTNVYLHMSCNLPFHSTKLSFFFNLSLMSVTVALAYMSRKLPSNFNETRFIFACGCVSVILLFVYTPTYMAQDDIIIRVRILNLAILINHTIFLCALFVPKVYAVTFEAQRHYFSRIRVTRFQEADGIGIGITDEELAMHRPTVFRRVRAMKESRKESKYIFSAANYPASSSLAVPLAEDSATDYLARSPSGVSFLDDFLSVRNDDLEDNFDDVMPENKNRKIGSPGEYWVGLEQLDNHSINSSNFSVLELEGVRVSTNISGFEHADMTNASQLKTSHEKETLFPAKDGGKMKAEITSEVQDQIAKDQVNSAEEKTLLPAQDGEAKTEKSIQALDHLSGNSVDSVEKTLLTTQNGKVKTEISTQAQDHLPGNSIDSVETTLFPAKDGKVKTEISTQAQDHLPGNSVDSVEKTLLNTQNGQVKTEISIQAQDRLAKD
jgi:hypothetical protein